MGSQLKQNFIIEFSRNAVTVCIEFVSVRLCGQRPSLLSFTNPFMGTLIVLGNSEGLFPFLGIWNLPMRIILSNDLSHPSWSFAKNSTNLVDRASVSLFEM